MKNKILEVLNKKTIFCKYNGFSIIEEGKLRELAKELEDLFAWRSISITFTEKEEQDFEKWVNDCVYLKHNALYNFKGYWFDENGIRRIYKKTIECKMSKIERDTRFIDKAMNWNEIDDLQKLELVKHNLILGVEKLKEGLWVVCKNNGDVRMVSHLKMPFNEFSDNGYISGIGPSDYCNIDNYEIINATTYNKTYNKETYDKSPSEIIEHEDGSRTLNLKLSERTIECKTVLLSPITGKRMYKTVRTERYKHKGIDVSYQFEYYIDRSDPTNHQEYNTTELDERNLKRMYEAYNATVELYKKQYKFYKEALKEHFKEEKANNKDVNIKAYDEVLKWWVALSIDESIKIKNKYDFTTLGGLTLEVVKYIKENEDREKQIEQGKISASKNY